MAKNIKCPISGDPMESVFSNTILNKYNVVYYYCKTCGLLKTEKPYWLEEAYLNPIAHTDTGLLMRNISNSKMIEVILKGLSLEKGKFLDVAGGYGLLTRLMRDKGFDFFTMDKYCENLFAYKFEPDIGFRADALFAFEVLEHIENPLEYLQTLFDRYACKTLIFSTLVFSKEVPPKSWWYYSFESGQHITFYQQRTLTCLAEKLNCRYYMINPAYHIFSDTEIPWIRRSLICSRFLRKLFSTYINLRPNRESNIWADHLNIKTVPTDD